MLLDDPSNPGSRKKSYTEGQTNQDGSSDIVQKQPAENPPAQAPTQREVLSDEPKTARLLAFVQVLTASFASFAHGSNDVRFVSIDICERLYSKSSARGR